MIYFDATHTSHTAAQTGIQRVCRSLFIEGQKISDLTPICRDPYQGAWRTLSANETAQLRYAGPPGRSRGSLWTQRQRLGGHARRLLKLAAPLPPADGVICPEFFSAKVGAHLPELFSVVRGPRVALFYDAIPLQFPELTPPATVARFPAYLRELLQFDGVAAISETSAQILRDYWRWLGVTQPPPVVAIPLAAEPPPRVDPPAAPPQPPRVLCVSTIEGRKNHGALLDACEQLWAEGLAFELHLIGLARPDTAGPALAKIAALQAAGRPLRYAGVASNAAIVEAYRACTFTVYPSLVEGFGLPVLESVGHGKPCVCSAHGALGECSVGGGCVALAEVTGASLATAIRRLVLAPAEVETLAAAARRRRFKTWPEYAAEVASWMQGVRRRA